MKVLIKLGGTLLEQEQSRLRLAREIEEIRRDFDVVVVSTLA